MALLIDATATGAGSDTLIAQGNRYSPSNHTVQVEITGAPTAVTVAIEARLTEGTLWSTIVTHVMSAEELAATIAMFHINGYSLSNIRANVTVLTGGTAPTVSVYHVGGA